MENKTLQLKIKTRWRENLQQFNTLTVVAHQMQFNRRPVQQTVDISVIYVFCRTIED